jgi:UDP-N-acetylmuramoyl-L-alanyl-D-glutamate--2,6-diaminopimelate ligase
MWHRLKAFVPQNVMNAYHYFLAHLAAFVYRYPSDSLIVIGVTGTNGKTTTTYLLAKALEAMGEKAGCTSTAVLKIGEKEWINDTKMTMPGRFFIQRMLRQMVNKGCRYAVIETSSQGLIQHRHLGIAYDGAVFTNLTPEHIEAHGGFEAYKAAKGLLFQHVASRPPKQIGGVRIPQFVVLNADSPHASAYATWSGAADLVWYGREAKKGLFPQEVDLTDRGTDLVVKGCYGHLQLPGAYNVENTLAALAVAEKVGIPLDRALAAIAAVAFVPGRSERISLGQPFEVMVDYAAEPAALSKLYEMLRLWKKKRLIHVLGSCGGGRDVARRPILGDLAGKEADLVIVTNEDPYDDDPRQIMEQVAMGAEKVGKQRGKDLLLIEDRAEAIRQAIRLAEPGDFVLMTGKGSEAWMCVANGKKIPWSERLIAEKAIRERMSE